MIVTSYDVKLARSVNTWLVEPGDVVTSHVPT